LYDLIN